MGFLTERKLFRVQRRLIGPETYGSTKKKNIKWTKNRWPISRGEVCTLTSKIFLSQPLNQNTKSSLEEGGKGYIIFNKFFLVQLKSLRGDILRANLYLHKWCTKLLGLILRWRQNLVFLAITSLIHRYQYIQTDWIRIYVTALDDVNMIVKRALRRW